jgi:hypothetical protein
VVFLLDSILQNRAVIDNWSSSITVWFLRSAAIGKLVGVAATPIPIDEHPTMGRSIGSSLGPKTFTFP